MNTYGRRLRTALTTRPRPGHWLETGLLALGFAAVAWPVALDAGLIDGGPPVLSAALVPLALRIMLVPALAEEVIFRVLPNPHPAEGSRAPARAAALSLLAYIAAHPLLALFIPAAEVFLMPQFLLLAALLGVACLVAYLRSGSVWPPALLHWLMVFAWLGLGGSGVLGGAL